MSDVEAKLAELGKKLPESAPPLFNYVPYVVTGNMVFVAGQVPIGGDHDYKGKVGIDIDMDTAKEAAEQCALNILRQVSDAVNGDWSRVMRCVRRTARSEVIPAAAARCGSKRTTRSMSLE